MTFCTTQLNLFTSLIIIFHNIKFKTRILICIHGNHVHVWLMQSAFLSHASSGSFVVFSVSELFVSSQPYALCCTCTRRTLTIHPYSLFQAIHIERHREPSFRPVFVTSLNALAIKFNHFPVRCRKTLVFQSRITSQSSISLVHLFLVARALLTQFSRDNRSFWHFIRNAQI